MTAPLDPAPPQRSRKRWIALSILGVVLIIGAIGGVLYWLHARKFETTDDAYVDGDVVTVSPQVAGRIKTVLVNDNQDVAAGDLIAEIDKTDFVTRVKQLEAALEAAKARVDVARTNIDLVRATTQATLAQAEAGVEAAQATVEQAQSAVAQAQAMVKWAQAQVQSAQADVDAAQAEASRRDADVKRFESVDPRALSQQARDQARSAAEAAEAQLSAAQKRKSAADAQVAQEESHLAESRSAVVQAQAKVTQARGVVLAAQTGPQQVATAEAQLKTAQAAVDQAQAELQAGQQQLEYTSIRAPVSGRITRKAVELGQYVEAGRVLVSIVEPDVWITANFKETQLTHMHAGQVVDIKVDAYPGRTFRGQVASIQAGTGARFSLMPPENATGNYVKVVQRVPVKITFNEDPSAKQLLAPGMSAVPKVHVAENEGTPEPIVRGPATQPVVTVNK